MKLLFKRFLAGIFDFILLCLFLDGCDHLHGGLRWAVFVVGIAVWLELCFRLQGSVGKAVFDLGIAFERRSTVILRELVGKTASAITLGLGLVPILFPEHKGLEDYIAGTNVVPIVRSRGLVDTLRIFAAVAVTAAVTLLFASGSSTPPAQTAAIAAPAPAWAVSDAMGAVMTINVYHGKELEAQGSGFIISPDGRAITNVHVLRDGDNAEVILGDGRKFSVTSVVAFDAAKDLALFKIGPASAPFPTLTLGASKDINVGERVIIIGSPEGLNNTVSEGILSAKRPETKDEQALMQVSAPISPGSSGGPVFDSAGGVIGVAQSTLEEGQNLNFAIPVEVVQQLVHGTAANLTPAAFYRKLAAMPNDDEESASEEAAPTPSKPTPAKPALPQPSRPPPQPSRSNGNGVTATLIPGR